MKNCPFCWEKIQEQAKKCRFCGEWLDKKTVKEVKSKKKETKEVSKTEKVEIDPIKKAEYNIKVAYILSIITIILTLIMFFVKLWESDNIYLLIDVVFFALFTFWIYKKSRVAAICAFSYFLIWKIIQLIGWNVSGIIRWILFGIGFFKWIQWTISYSELTDNKETKIREIILWILTGVMIVFALIGTLIQ